MDEYTTLRIKKETKKRFKALTGDSKSADTALNKLMNKIKKEVKENEKNNN